MGAHLESRSYVTVETKGRRPMPAARDFTREDANSMQAGHPLKLPSPIKLARLGHFPPASQAPCRPRVLCIWLFSGRDDQAAFAR